MDGRGWMDVRDVNFHFADDAGQVEVSLGGTRAMCVVSGEIVVPSRERPNEGLLFFRVNFGSLASSLPQQAGGAGARLFEEEANEICSIIERLLKGSRAIDTEALCISAGLEAWSIKVEVRALEADGNLKDACALAAIAGLLHFRREDKKSQGDISGARTAGVGADMPLSIHHIPVLLSFGFCGGEKICVLDPSAAEEEVLTGTVSLAVNQFRDLCGIHKPGGEPLSMKSFAWMLKVAEEQAKIVIQKLEKALQDDRKKLQSKMQRLHYRYSSSAPKVSVVPYMPLCKQDSIPSLLASPLPWESPAGLPPPRPAESMLLSSAPPVARSSLRGIPQVGTHGAPHSANLEKLSDGGICDVPHNVQHLPETPSVGVRVPDDCKTVKKLLVSSTPPDGRELDGSDGADSDLANAVKKRRKVPKKKR